jgi:hypothetical protein
MIYTSSKIHISKIFSMANGVPLPKSFVSLLGLATDLLFETKFSNLVSITNNTIEASRKTTGIIPTLKLFIQFSMDEEIVNTSLVFNTVIHQLQRSPICSLLLKLVTFSILRIFLPVRFDFLNEYFLDTNFGGTAYGSIEGS